MTTHTLHDVREALNGFDQVSKLKNGNFVARMAFFYTHGMTSEQHAKKVLIQLPDAIIVKHEEIWKPFKGGASIKNQSHFYVEFNFKES